MKEPLPLLSGRLAWWMTSWLRGLVGADDLIDGLSPDGAIHHVAGVGHTGDLTPLLLALGEVRLAGATVAGIALPVPGDLVGLGGPARFNTDALEAGEAVTLIGGDTALVPHSAGGGVVWQWHEAHARMMVTDLGQASRDLRRQLLESATVISDLEVARWRPELADELMDLRRPRMYAAPPGTPASAAELAARATQAERIVELALADDGGATSLEEIERRRQALLPLDRAARHALVAACSSDAWPKE